MLSESLIKLGEQFQDREVSRAEYDMREKELKHLQRELAYLELHGAYWHVRTRHLEPQAALMESGSGGSRGGREQLGLSQWADVRARAVTRMRSLKTKQGWTTMAQATKLAVVGLTRQAIRATRSKTSLGKPGYEEGPHGPGRANAGRSYCILLSVVLFCLLLIPSIGWSKANSYLESGAPHNCCVNGACYESPPCNEHAQCVHLESVAGLDVFSSSCHRLLSDLLEAGPDEEVGKLCPCSCSRAHKPVLATLRSSTGLAGSSDNSMLLQFGLCTLSTPRLTVTVYNSDYDDKSEVGSFRAREYLEIFFDGEKVATCDPPSNDCSPFVCLDEVDVSRWTKNGSLHVTMVNSPDVSVGGCDGTGGTGDWRLAADLRLDGCMREPAQAGGDEVCYDCKGVGLGPNTRDMCGTCDADPLNDCRQDCVGVWGGTAKTDGCGVCGGTNSTCADCRGQLHGTFRADNCGRCDADASNDCVADCAGTWGGVLITDACGVCGGDGKACAQTGARLDGVYSITGAVDVPTFMAAILRLYRQRYDGGTLPSADVVVAVPRYTQTNVGNIVLPFNPAAAMATQTTCAHLRSSLSAILKIDMDYIHVTSNIDFAKQQCLFHFVVTTQSDIAVRFIQPDFLSQVKHKSRLAVLLGNPTMVFNGASFAEADVSVADMVVTSIFHFGVTVRAIDALLPSVMDSVIAEGIFVSTLNSFSVPTSAAVLDPAAVVDLQFDCAGRIPGLNSPWMPATMKTGLASVKWPAQYDACGICGGNGSTCTDCKGVPHGAAPSDRCGLCGIDALRHSCLADCGGVWGGARTFDACGVCDADKSNDCQQDCAGIWGGFATLDVCGQCNTPDKACAPAKCSYLRHMPLFSTFEEERETAARDRIVVLQLSRNETMDQLSQSVVASTQVKRPARPEPSAASNGSQADQLEQMIQSLQLTVRELDAEMAELDRQLEQGELIGCVLQTSWEYRYDLSPYRGLQRVQDTAGNVLLFDLCGPVSTAAVPLMFRPACANVRSPIFQVPSVPDMLTVKGFSCTTAAGFPHGVPFSRGQDINRKPHWTSAQYHIYFSGAYWYLDSDLSPEPANFFTPGYWARISASSLFTCGTVPDGSALPCQIAGRMCPPCAKDDGDAELRDSPVGYFTGWQEFCGASRGYVPRIANLDPGCDAAPGQWYTAEKVTTTRTVASAPEENTDRLLPNCTTGVPGQWYANSSSTGTVNCASFQGSLSLGVDLLSLVVHLDNRPARRREFARDVSLGVASLLTSEGESIVNTADVRVVKVQEGNTLNGPSITVRFIVAVLDTDASRTLLASKNYEYVSDGSNTSLVSKVFRIVEAGELLPINATMASNLSRLTWWDHLVEVPCRDDPPGWHPTGLLFDCQYFAKEKFCSVVTDKFGQTISGPGSKWSSLLFGPLQSFTDEKGLAPTDVCCACGGGYNGPEPQPEPEPEPEICADDKDGLLANGGLTCSSALASTAGNCTGVQLLGGVNLSSLCPISCNSGCGYVPTLAERLAAASANSRRRVQDNSISPSPATPDRPPLFGRFFNVVEIFDTQTVLNNGESTRGQKMLSGVDVLRHSVQLLHLPVHPELYRVDGESASPHRPIVFNLSCSRSDAAPSLSTGNVTIHHWYPNGSVTFSASAVIVQWPMRGACPSFPLHVERDIFARAELGPILAALRSHGISALLCVLIICGWLAVAVLDRRGVDAPSALELYPFRHTELIPGILSREAVSVAFQRAEVAFVRRAVVADGIFFAGAYLWMLGALVWLTSAVAAAGGICGTEGDHPAGNMWRGSVWLTICSFVAQVAGVVGCWRAARSR